MDEAAQVLVPETYGDELATAEAATRQRRGPAPTVEEHLAQHPAARPIHDRLARLFPRQRTSSFQIAYRAVIDGRELSVIQMYFPDRRLYFTDLEKAGAASSTISDAALKRVS